jgi:hypothetical protein
LRGGIHWASWTGSDPLYKFLTGEREIYADFERRLPEEIAEELKTAEIRDGVVHFRKGERLERGATWTYISTDQPFGTYFERVKKGLRRQWGRPPVAKRVTQR